MPVSSEAIVDALEQRAATGERDATVHDVGGEFGRGLVEGRLHGITDRSDGLFERLADVVG